MKNQVDEITAFNGVGADRNLKLVDDLRLADEKYRIVEQHQDAHAIDAERTLFRALHACGYELTATKSRRRLTTLCRTRVARLQRRIVDYLVRSHLGLVYEMGRRWSLAEQDEDEYVSTGFWCLYQSIMAFDPWRGYRFSTYACNAILRGYGHVWKQKCARRRRLNRYVALNIKQLTTESYDGSPEPGDASVLRNRLTDALQSNDVQLTPIERLVIEQRFLRSDRGRGPTLATVGKLVRLSKERVRQIQLAALGKLRAALQDDPVIRTALETL